MKQTLLLLVFLGLLITGAKSQTVYSTTGGEFIFGFSEVERNGTSLNTNMRFSLFFHLGEYLHYDINDKLGFFSGLAVRNVGFIDFEPYQGQDNIETRRRSYALGVPLALKIGSLDNDIYLYGGGEYELMFVYKEKHYINDEKIKSVDWFSDKVNLLMPSLFVGIQFPKGINLQFKYYMKDFLSDEYRATLENQSNQLYYLSVSYRLRNHLIMHKMQNGGGNMAFK
jgi:hypothetical protein